MGYTKGKRFRKNKRKNFRYTRRHGGGPYDGYSYDYVKDFTYNDPDPDIYRVSPYDTGNTYNPKETYHRVRNASKGDGQEMLTFAELNMYKVEHAKTMVFASQTALDMLAGTGPYYKITIKQALKNPLVNKLYLATKKYYVVDLTNKYPSATIDQIKNRADLDAMNYLRVIRKDERDIVNSMRL